jgi:CheY-like chemotaxis protein
MSPVTTIAATPELPTKTTRLQKILVVEDQEAVRAVACGFLTDFGYDVVEAEDGFQALSKLQEDPGHRPHVLGYRMPGG